MQKPIEKIIVDIITHELNLPENYRKTSKGDVIPCVVILGQNIKLFNTDKLQITVSVGDFKTFSNRNEFKTDDKGNFIQVQDINQQCIIQIDCYSRNNDARNRHHEIIMALNSIYAHQLMDLYNFKLGIIGNTVNMSGIDGGSSINRYVTTAQALIHQQKISVIDYYDKFSEKIYHDNPPKDIPYFSSLDWNLEPIAAQGGFSTFDDFDEIDGSVLTYNDL